jgi:hypothetical protein
MSNVESPEKYKHPLNCLCDLHRFLNKPRQSEEEFEKACKKFKDDIA